MEKTGGPILLGKAGGTGLTYWLSLEVRLELHNMNIGSNFYDLNHQKTHIIKVPAALLGLARNVSSRTLMEIFRKDSNQPKSVVTNNHQDNFGSRNGLEI